MDMYGSAVILQHSCGIDAHPFTRDAHAAALLEKLQNIALKSLFEKRDVYRGNAPDKTKTTVDELLQGKTIIIYLDSMCNTMFFDKLVSAYHKKKLECPKGLELVSFHNLKGDPTPEEVKGVESRMPWYVTGARTHSQDLIELINCFGHRGLFGFGVDGKLCSFQELLLNENDEAELCLYQTLEKDVKRLCGYTKFTRI